MKYRLLFLAANDGLGLLKLIRSVASIVYVREFDMKVLGSNQACSASFSLRVDAVLVVVIERVLWMAAGLYNPPSIHPKHNADCFKWSSGW